MWEGWRVEGCECGEGGELRMWEGCMGIGEGVRYTCILWMYACNHYHQHMHCGWESVGYVKDHLDERFLVSNSSQYD